MIDQPTGINESRMVEEFSKPEPELNPGELSNIETVQKTIKRYQHKVSEMLKVIQKQKKHNDTLKAELKTLNDTLNTMIEKINVKSQKKEDHHKEDITKKALENEIKKNVNMKKELDSLRAKVKVFEGQKIIDLQDEIRQKDKVIEELNSSIKMYQKIEKQEMNSDIYRKYQEANEKINSLNGELVHIKKKLTDAKKHQDMQEKSLKRQHEQLLSIENKDKSSRVVLRKEEARNEEANAEIKKLKETIESLSSAKKTNEKALRHEIENLKLKNRVLEGELEETRTKVSRKEKEANILVSKMKEISRKSHHTLEPVDKNHGNLFQDDLSKNSSGLFDHRKQFKGLTHLQANSKKFEDAEQLPLEKNYRIKNLHFVWFEEHILELQSQYELPDHSLKTVDSFKLSHSYKNTSSADLAFSEFEYIKDIEVYCGKFIEFIRIRTSRDQVLEVGNERNYTKCKKFTFDIRTSEKPIAFMGLIQNKKLNENSKEHLVAIGLEIKKKEIFTRTRFHPSVRAQSLKKAASKTGFQESNDKNVIKEEI